MVSIICHFGKGKTMDYGSSIKLSDFWKFRRRERKQNKWRGDI